MTSDVFEKRKDAARRTQTVYT